MGQIVITGSVVVGPASPVSDGAFPSSIDTVQLASTPNPKQSQVCSGTISRFLNVASPSWATLSGVGAADTVTRADTLYLRCNSPIKVRLTQADKDGGADIVSIVEVHGVLLQEFPQNGCLKLLEAQGSATLEYFVSGLL